MNMLPAYFIIDPQVLNGNNYFNIFSGLSDIAITIWHGMACMN